MRLSEVEQKYGYIDTSGKMVIPSQFESAEEFSEGLAGVAWAGTNMASFLVGVSSTGPARLLCLPRLSIWKFLRWLGPSKVGQVNKWGYVDKTGKMVIPPQFDWGGKFSEGLAVVKWGKNVGYIDKTGKMVISPQFDGGGSFNEGLAAVKLKEKWGFIDKTGKLAIPLQFDWAAGPWVTGTWGFSDGLAPVQQGKKWGFIDKNGKMVIPPRYNGALKFSEGLAAVEIGEEDVEEPGALSTRRVKWLSHRSFVSRLIPLRGNLRTTGGFLRRTG